MQGKTGNTQSGRFLKRLIELEDLVEKKTKIYSRLLTDVALAKEMEALSLRHEKRKERIVKLTCKESKTSAKGVGRYEMNGEGNEE